MNKNFFLIPAVLILFSCTTIEEPESYTLPEPDIKDNNLEKENRSERVIPSLPVKEILPVKKEEPEVILMPGTSPLRKHPVLSEYPLPELPSNEISVPEVSPDEPVKNNHRIPLLPPVRNSYHDRGTPAAEKNVEKKAVSPETTENSIVVYNKEKAVVTLQGTGWIFLGGMPAGEIFFTDKVIRRDSVEFYFRALHLGDFTLKFQQQNSLTGGFSRQSILLSIKKPVEKNNNNGITIDNSPAKKEQLPISLDQIIKDGKYDEAFKYFDEHEILLKLLTDGVKKNDAAELEYFYDKVFKKKEPASEVIIPGDFFPQILSAGMILLQNGYVQKGVKLLEASLLMDNEPEGEDSLLFTLGDLYQNKTSIRDERKAAYFYKKLVDNYPASIYWDAARKEYMFIKRRYIDVR